MPVAARTRQGGETLCERPPRNRLVPARLKLIPIGATRTTNALPPKSGAQKACHLQEQSLRSLLALPIAFGVFQAPSTAGATLTISGHNATNAPASQTWVYPLTATITPPVALDVAVVVDRSDSMNQALGSRIKVDAAISASELLVELLRPDLDDRVAVVRFNNDRNVIRGIVPVSASNAPTQSAIRDKIRTDVPPATGLTAIAGGAMLGIHEVEQPHPGNPSPLTQAVVVLTDGIENTGFEENGTWQSIVGGQMWKTDLSGKVQTVPAVWPAQIKRYAVGVGRTNEIDIGQLTALTGGSNRVFRVDQDLTGLHYFQLEKYFTAIFMDVLGSQSIVDPIYDINPGDSHEIEFESLSGDVDAIVVIYDYEGARLPFFCVSPKGEIVDPMSLPPGFQLRSGFPRETRMVQFKMPPLEPEVCGHVARGRPLSGRAVLWHPGFAGQGAGLLPTGVPDRGRESSAVRDCDRRGLEFPDATVRHTRSGLGG